MGTIYEYFKGINIESLSTRDIDLKSSSKKRKMSRNINSLKKPSRKIMKNDQYTLDFGQTQEKICPECGMFYSVGSKVDEYNHMKYHKELSSTIRFVGWKDMNIVYKKSLDEYIVSVDKNNYSRKKVKEIREFVDKKLGFSSERKSKDEKMYLYIANKKLVGCIIVEMIDHAYRLSKTSKDDMSITINKVKVPALVGVSRIWVFTPHRRKGIATTLLDVMRSDIIYGSIVPKNKIALSQPTLDGKRFGMKYFDNEMFLVYEYENCVENEKEQSLKNV